jgi:hypothetical protein
VKCPLKIWSQNLTVPTSSHSFHRQPFLWSTLTHYSTYNTLKSWTIWTSNFWKKSWQR